jgi:hypothetical protein
MTNDHMTTEGKIAAIQAILSVEVTGLWNDKTQTAFETLLNLEPTKTAYMRGMKDEYERLRNANQLVKTDLI